MPVTKKPDGWYWGGKGPFKSKEKATEVGQAAYAGGYKKKGSKKKKASNVNLDHIP